ncbi:MAG: rhodoquinone biosynthesis methyltransferase RquA [Xanthomonadales bacterium]|nr:rhodoquinone biosynthesis methyltransferase RquA [Xanthomonadales bacterium]
MTENTRAIAETYQYTSTDQADQGTGEDTPVVPPSIPPYLQDTYWWAYLHPKSFWFFEREWVVNLILWGNMKKLTNAVLDEMELQPRSSVLQVACVYGDFSNRLASHLVPSHSRLSIVDVAPIQLKNLEKKLAGQDNVSVHHQDSTCMGFPTDSFEETVVFFLLHEQPEHARCKTVEEAIRVTRPGGRITFVDYHGPKRSNPMRYVMKPILSLLEPFAMDLWREELPAFMPADIKPEQIESEFYFGGLYQKVVIRV